MGKHSKNKGSGFERTVAKILSEWSGIQLVRTPMSGGWSGSIADVWPRDTSIYFPMVVECKKVEGWTLDQLLSAKGPLMEWLDQAIDQARSVANEKGLPYEEVLVASSNRRPVYVVLKLYMLPGDFRKPIVVFVHRDDVYCLVVLNDYLECVSLERFKHLMEVVEE